MTSFYELARPTSWAAAPERYSFSTLQALEVCPRKWQLLHSRWGDHPRFPERPHPKAIEGAIVHEAIERLVRALGRRGLPSIGSPGFRAAVEAVGFWEFFGRETHAWNERLSQHPRSGPFFVLRTPPRELANRAIRLFREQYEPRDGNAPPDPVGSAEEPRKAANPMTLLRARGVLSEFALAHPEKPFGGVIDLVQLVDDEVQIVDFKTGAPKDEHELQLRLYAALWWRCSGVRPSRAAVQYLNYRRELRLIEQHLVDAEAHIDSAIDDARRRLGRQPAEAHPGKDCGFCPVRARCNEGWRAYQDAAGRTREGTTDVEAAVAAKPTPSGFLANAGGREVNVVHDVAVGHGLPKLEIGDRLRLLDVVARDDGRTFEVRPWTEVYTMSEVC